jgi:hypothetical protein
MTLEPGEEHIQNIIEIAGLSRPKAIVLLQVRRAAAPPISVAQLRTYQNYNNDTERAISAYFDDPANALRETVSFEIFVDVFTLN